MKRIAWVAAWLVAGFSPLTGLAQIAPADQAVDGPALVQEAKQSQDWLARVKSFRVRFETEYIRAPAAAANPPPQSGAAPQPPATQPSDAMAHPAMQKRVGTLEIAFDQKRLYQANGLPGATILRTQSWDGHVLVGNQGRENYYEVSDSPNALARPFMAGVIWGRNGQVYWWHQTQDDFMGPAEQYTLAGHELYHGIDCFVLSEPQRDRQVHIGAKDHRLYGLKQGEILSWFFTDYKEVAPGRWFPMTQGSDNINADSRTPPLMNIMRATEVVIDQPLPDELFKPALKDGMHIHETRGGATRDFIYRVITSPS